VENAPIDQSIILKGTASQRIEFAKQKSSKLLSGRRGVFI
jgi:hypothetical protein